MNHIILLAMYLYFTSWESRKTFVVNVSHIYWKWFSRQPKLWSFQIFNQYLSVYHLRGWYIEFFFKPTSISRVESISIEDIKLIERYNTSIYLLPNPPIRQRVLNNGASFALPSPPLSTIGSEEGNYMAVEFSRTEEITRPFCKTIKSTFQRTI